MMSEDEVSLLKKNVELYIRHFEETFEALGAEDKANFIVDKIRGDGYEIRRWKKPRQYLLIEENERPPCCHGCFNEFGSCGTPCVDCKDFEAFKVNWDWMLFMSNMFTIYKLNHHD